MLGMIGGIAGAAFGGPVGGAIGGAIGNAIGGGGNNQQAQAFEAALQSFAMQIVNDTMGDFDEAMSDTDEDFDQ